MGSTFGAALCMVEMDTTCFQKWLSQKALYAYLILFALLVGIYSALRLLVGKCVDANIVFIF